jgi:GTPase SAR1 family protein
MNYIDFDKYKPKSFQEFLGSYGLIQKIKTVILQPSFQLLIIGPSGGGKTTLSNLIIQTLEDKYDVLSIYSEVYEDMKGLKSLIHNFMYNKTIESYFSKKKKLILLDDIDILISNERNANSFILSLVEDTLNMEKLSILITCTNSEEKRLTELKKKIGYERISVPSKQDLLVYFSNLLENEKIEYDGEKLLKMIDVYNHNVRNIMYNLHSLYVSDDKLNIEKSHRVMFDSTAFTMMETLYKKHLNFQELRQISDNSLVPMLLYENYYTELFKHKEKLGKKDYLKIIDDVSSGYLSGDIMENYMYQNIEWSLYDYVTFLKCGYINYHFNKIAATKKSSPFQPYAFTQLLTKAALRCNFNKKLLELKYHFNIHNTSDILYLLDCISNEIIEKPNILKDKQLFKKYNITSEHLATMCQYFSQFLELDKSILSKIKKLK